MVHLTQSKTTSKPCCTRAAVQLCITLYTRGGEYHGKYHGVYQDAYHGKYHVAYHGPYQGAYGGAKHVQDRSQEWSIPKLTVAMIPAQLSDSQENNRRMESAKQNKNTTIVSYETSPAEPNFLQTEYRGRQMSIDVHPVCAGVTKRTTTLKRSPQRKDEVSSLRETVRDPAPTTVLMASPPAYH